VKFFSKCLNKTTLLSVAAYAFVFAVCAKGVYFYESQHPLKEELFSVHGAVRNVRLGGQGKSTSLKIESKYGTHRYSSYYGKVWPGMELIKHGDLIDLLAERNRLNKNEFSEGKRFYIWELTHQDQIIINYEDVRKMIQGKEAIVNRYINLWLATGFFFLVVVYLHKIIFK
jgi:hypothetical protein